MKKTNKLLSLLLLACIFVGTLAACGEKTPPEPEHIDYSASVKLDDTSDSLKQEVTVKMFIDGDTTHFYVPNSVIEGGVLKARYLAVDTPESTGKIEAWGKTASNFTKEKLSTATSIIVESDNGKWNADSTGSRYLVWVWYKPAGAEEYRNLNIEILQSGLAIASNSGQNRYGETCLAAIAQAEREKLCVHSKEKDPNFYYGEAVELTLRELRTNVEAYSGMKVAFNGIVTMNRDQSVYVENFDPETGLYYGMSVYYGYGMSGAGLDILSVGNEVRIVGTLQYYEAGGTWQVSGLTYRMMKPKDPGNIQKISDGHSPAWTPTSAATFVSQVTLMEEEGSQLYDYADLAMGTSLEIKNLTVKSVYTTMDEESSSYGALTLTCESDGVTVHVRTIPLYGTDGRLITEDLFAGKNISVKGIVDYFDGQYQVKVFTLNHITFND